MDQNETKLFPIWKELVKVADKWDYGTFHSHEEIASILDVESQSTKYYGLVKKARTTLIEHHKLLETRIDSGYHVTEVNRYNEVTFEDIKKSKEHLERSLWITRFAPVELMDEKTKKKHDLFLVKQVGLLNMTLPFYTEITKVIAPIPSRFRIKEAKPNIEDNHEND